MTLLLIVVFVVVPIIELTVIVAVRDVLGLGETLMLLVLVSVVGAWLVKQQGLGILRRVRAQLDAHRVPAGELVDGALVLAGGALMLTPGFVTDAVGLLLIVPPTRVLARTVLIGRFRARARVLTFGASAWSGPVVDAEATDERSEDGAPALPPQRRRRLDP